MIVGFLEAGLHNLQVQNHVINIQQEEESPEGMSALQAAALQTKDNSKRSYETEKMSHVLDSVVKHL